MLFERPVDLQKALFVIRQLLADLGETCLDLLKVILLLLPGFTGVLDGLLKAGDLGTERIVTPLYLVELVIGIRVIRTLLLDLGLEFTLRRDRRLEPVFLLGELAFALLHLFIECLPAQQQELTLEFTLLGFPDLVFLGRGSLSFEMLELLGDLLDEILEAIKIFACMPDAVLCLAAAFLVLGNSGCLLEIDAQVFWARLDDAGDHPLLDDGVAAGTESRAEKQIRDITAAATDIVEKIVRLAIAADLPLDRNLGITGVLAARTAVTVVEDEFDGGSANRFAARGAVEDDIRHRLAAEHFGRTLSHDPAYGIDDIRLATAVRTDNTNEVCREFSGGRIDEGFESGEFYFFQSHGALGY